VRQTAASVETAKEVKIFGLNGFLIDRYKRLAADVLRRQPRARGEARGVGRACTTVGTIGYYAAYAYIVWRTLHGEFSIGDLTFLSARSCACAAAREPAVRLLSVAGQALYLNDLFSFFETRPEILSPPTPGRSRSRSATASCSRTSASSIPAPSAGRCAI
jgi:ATP-binding cassette subfamily B protein